MQPRAVEVSVAEGYARWAREYDAYPNLLIAAEQAPFRALVGDVRGRDVLDAACGTGRHAAWLLAEGARVVGVDASDDMLEHARRRCPGADLRRGSVLALEDAGVAARSFDVVINALMAEHVEDLGALARSLRRPLRAGGRLVLSVWHPFMVLKGVRTHYEDAAAETEYVLPTFPHLVSDYVRAFASAGLALVDMQEPICDAAVVACCQGRGAKHVGMPLALILAARAA